MILDLFRKVFKKKEFNPKNFWNEWALTFMQDKWQMQIHPQHDWILKKIKNNKNGTILEIGCGFGRNIKFLIENKIDPKMLVGMDISNKMLKKAEKYIKNKKVKLIIGDAQMLPFSNKSFDIVLIHGVFMHIDKKNVEKAIKEAIRVSRKYILQVEQNYDADNNYTFVHDYKKLYVKNKVKILEYKNNKTLGLDYLYVKVR